MKRLCTFLLALLLILGAFPLSVGAVPKTNIRGFSAGADVLNTDYVDDFGDLILGSEETVLKIPIKFDGFNVTGGLTDGDKGSSDVANRVVLKYEENGEDATDKFNEIFSVIPHKISYTTADEAAFILVAKSIGEIDGEIYAQWLTNPDQPGDVYNLREFDSMKYQIRGSFIDPTIDKRIVALSGQNLAYDARYVAHNGRKIFEYDISLPEADLKAAQKELEAQLNYMLIQPGDTLEFSLHTDHFIWNPDSDQMRGTVRRSTLENDQVNALRTILEGSNIIESVDFENRAGESAVFIVRFKEDWPHTKERDFAFNLALGMFGERNYKAGGKDTSVNIYGSFGNPVYYVHEDNDYVFIGDGMVVEAENYVRNIELDLDNGVSVFANLFEGRRYWGKSSEKRTKDDNDIMNFFPSIRKAITLDVVGIDKVAKYVKIDQEANYHVYDAYGQYLGQTHEELPFRTKYYLSTELLNFEWEGAKEIWEKAPIEIGIEGDGTNPPTGGAPPVNLAPALALGGVAVGGLLVARKCNNRKMK